MELSRFQSIMGLIVIISYAVSIIAFIITRWFKNQNKIQIELQQEEIDKYGKTRDFAYIEHFFFDTFFDIFYEPPSKKSKYYQFSEVRNLIDSYYNYRKYQWYSVGLLFITAVTHFLLSFFI